MVIKALMVKRSQYFSVEFSPSADWVIGGWVGGMRDDSVEILFQCFLQETLESSSCMGRVSTL